MALPRNHLEAYGTCGVAAPQDRLQFTAEEHRRWDRNLRELVRRVDARRAAEHARRYERQRRRRARQDEAYASVGAAGYGRDEV